MGYAKRSTIDEWCGAGEQTDYVVDSCYIKGFLSSRFWQYVRDRRGQRIFLLPEDRSWGYSGLLHMMQGLFLDGEAGRVELHLEVRLAA